MAEMFLTGVQQTAAKKWLSLQVFKDGVTWFDLLGLPEGDVNPTDLNTAAQKRASHLANLQRKAEAQGKKDAQVVAGQFDLAPCVGQGSPLIHQIESPREGCQHGVIRPDVDRHEPLGIFRQQAFALVE